MQQPSPGQRFVRDSESKESRPVSLTRVNGEKFSLDALPRLRVLISDRDSMGSDLLANSLIRESGCDASAVRPEDLLQTLSTADVDLVIIGAELDAKSGSGFDLAHTVGCTHPNIYMVILLNHSSHESVINAFRSGARGVFSRQQPVGELHDCVEHVKRGFIWAGRQETSSLLEAFKNIPAPSLAIAGGSATLTARELQVVQCAAKGKTNKSIASELGLSEHTVKNYLFRAFEKLGVSSRVELLFYLTIREHTLGAKRADSVD